MKRVILAAIFCVLTAVSPADELLLMPTARRLPPGEVRGEIWAYGQLSGGILTAGLGQAWDAQISLDNFGGDPGRPTASLAYYYLSPLADIAPGLSAGILDAANETVDGRRVYACATMNRSLSVNSALGYTELTAGVVLGRHAGPMAGFRTPVSRRLSLLAEYDGYRFNAGAELRLGGGGYIRGATRGGVPFLVLGWRL